MTDVLLATAARPLPADSVPSGSPPAALEGARGAAYALALLPPAKSGRATDDDPPEGLVRGLWEHLQPIAEQWRELGVLGPRVEVPEDAPLLDGLRGLTGRRP